jgi:hypothetical protein
MDFALLNDTKGILLSTKGSETKTGSIPGSEVAGEWDDIGNKEEVAIASATSVSFGRKRHVQ